MAGSRPHSALAVPAAVAAALVLTLAGCSSGSPGTVTLPSAPTARATAAQGSGTVAGAAGPATAAGFCSRLVERFGPQSDPLGDPAQGRDALKAHLVAERARRIELLEAAPPNVRDMLTAVYPYFETSAHLLTVPGASDGGVKEVLNQPEFNSAAALLISYGRVACRARLTVVVNPALSPLSSAATPATGSPYCQVLAARVGPGADPEGSALLGSGTADQWKAHFARQRLERSRLLELAPPEQRDDVRTSIRYHEAWEMALTRAGYDIDKVDFAPVRAALTGDPTEPSRVGDAGVTQYARDTCGIQGITTGAA